MKKFIFICLSFIGFSSANENRVLSSFDFQTTTQKIKTFLSEKNITIFAEIDHSENAKQYGLSLPSSYVIIFGNPKVGTLLMQENIAASIDLPLKVAITKEGNSVFVEATNIAKLAKNYGIKNQEIIRAAQISLTSILKLVVDKPK